MKCNDCGKCPYYKWETDYWGECDEYCLLNFDIFKPCRKPMIIRKLVKLKLTIIDFYYELKMDRDYKKELKNWEEE